MASTIRAHSLGSVQSSASPMSSEQRPHHPLVDQRVAAARVHRDRGAEARLRHLHAARPRPLQARPVDDGHGEHAAVGPADDARRAAGRRRGARAASAARPPRRRSARCSGCRAPARSRRGSRAAPTSRRSARRSRGRGTTAAQSRVEADTPWQPCISTTAGNGPGAVRADLDRGDGARCRRRRVREGHRGTGARCEEDRRGKRHPRVARHASSIHRTAGIESGHGTIPSARSSTATTSDPGATRRRSASGSLQEAWGPDLVARAPRVSAAPDARAAGTPFKGTLPRGGLAALRADVGRGRHHVHAVAARDDAGLQPAALEAAKCAAKQGDEVFERVAPGALRGVLHPQPRHRRPGRARARSSARPGADLVALRRRPSSRPRARRRSSPTTRRPSASTACARSRP